jgi:hypothetical protein
MLSNYNQPNMKKERKKKEGKREEKGAAAGF